MKKAAYTWHTTSGYRLGRAPAIAGDKILWIKNKVDSISSDSSFFCVAAPKKK